jgi:hypothetical protein
MWLGVLFIIAFGSLCLELLYLFIYPILERAKAVELVESTASA